MRNPLMNPVRSSVSVIIPAAGSGRRFEDSRRLQRAGTRPAPTTTKLFSRIGNRPLIAHVLDAFDSLASVKEMIVALEPNALQLFRREVLSKTKFKKRVILVRGGNTRAESVWNCLKRVSKKSAYVCVHDGARPLIQEKWMRKLMADLNGWDAVVLGRRAVPTVKVFQPESGEIKHTLDRTELFEAETPQLITKEALMKSYAILGKERAFQATDDASLIEASGGRIKALVHQDPNIKVTTYQDLVLVKSLIEGERTLRFGLGYDRHRLVPKRVFYLGGIRIPSSIGPLGHSDGDPLLHAITDAILGAIGAGDIGDFFPNTSRRWKGVRSERFLAKALTVANGKGLQPVQVDATVILERPKLGSHKSKIQARIARLLSLAPDRVSVKAKTAEGLGPEGAGEAVSCQALVVLGPKE